MYKYNFEYILNCNMCGNDSSHNIVMGQRLNQSQGLKPKSKAGITVSVMRCKKCDLIYSNPQPKPFDIQDHYGIIPDNYWKQEYFKINDEYFLQEITKAKELINFESGMKALDIGAGIGKCMNALQSANFDAYGIEPSITFHKRAIKENNIDQNKLKLMTVENINYPSNYFDFITFGAVLEHLYDPSNAIKKAINWLKKDGIIHLEVPSSNWLVSKIVNYFYKLAGTNYVTNLSPMHTPFHLYEFGLKSFIEHSILCNYEIVFYEYTVCSIYHIPKIFHPVSRWYMKTNKSGMQLTIWLRKK